MNLYRKIGAYTYVVLLSLVVLVGVLSELFIDFAVTLIFAGVLAAGVITAALNLSKCAVVQVSNISLVLVLLGFLGTTLNTLPVVGTWLEGLWLALIAFNVPVALLTAITRICLVASHTKNSEEEH